MYIHTHIIHTHISNTHTHHIYIYIYIYIYMSMDDKPILFSQAPGKEALDEVVDTLNWDQFLGGEPLRALGLRSIYVVNDGRP